MLDPDLRRWHDHEMYKLSAAMVMLLCGVASADTAKPKPVASLKGKVTVGTPKLSGEVEVATVMKRSSTSLVACYRKALAAKPELKIEATAMFAIAPTGRVESSVVMGVEDASVEKCLADAIAKLKFAKPKDGKKVEVELPLVFDPAPPKAVDSDIYGGLLGNETGEMNGGFGYGRTGFGPGGGGTGWGTIGTGRYGTIGKGSGTGSGYGVGGGSGRSTTAYPTLRVGQPTATGDLDKAIIRRYIKRNYQKLLYCYEKELLAKPTLAGTITAQFTIGVDGLVSSSTASGLANANVEACVAGVIQAIEFPKPKNQSTVVVSYPLTYALPAKPSP